MVLGSPTHDQFNICLGMTILIIPTTDDIDEEDEDEDGDEDAEEITVVYQIMFFRIAIQWGFDWVGTCSIQGTPFIGQRVIMSRSEVLQYKYRVI